MMGGKKWYFRTYGRHMFPLFTVQQNRNLFFLFFLATFIRSGHWFRWMFMRIGTKHSWIVVNTHSAKIFLIYNPIFSMVMIKTCSVYLQKVQLCNRFFSDISFRFPRCFNEPTTKRVTWNSYSVFPFSSCRKYFFQGKRVVIRCRFDS